MATCRRISAINQDQPTIASATLFLLAGSEARLPSRGLPDLEGSLVPAEPPAYRQIQVARIVRDLGEMRRAVMKGITVYRPQELRLRVASRMQRREKGHTGHRPMAGPPAAGRRWGYRV